MVRFAPSTTYVLPSTSLLVRERTPAPDAFDAPAPSDSSDAGAPVEPSAPVDPAEPSAPVDPAEPSDRVESGDPVEPGDPVRPVEPAEPVDPIEPGDPVRSSAPAEPGDPFDDADALEELGCEIATLAAHIHAATARLLALIAEFDRRRGWELGGHRSCAHWLSARTGIDLGAAREKVRTARVLVGLPGTAAAMGRGELSFSKVRALTRVATADNEGDLLELARGCRTAQLERMVRAWKKGSRRDEADRERERWQSRRFSVFPDDEGMYVVKGRLPAEVGALLMRAVEAAGDALYREEWRGERERGEAGSRESGGRRGVAAAGPPAEESRRQAARRRADAVGLLAERALGVGFGGRGAQQASGPRPASEGSCSPAPVREVPAPSAPEAPISGTRAERYQVMLHVEPATLAATGEPGRAPTAAGIWSELEDGTRVSAETSRRLSCDAALVRVAHGEGRSPLSVGRRTRTIPPALRRALEVRDRGCRFPGCGLRFTDAHHVKHWADGGETSLSNCLLLCRHHHRLVHEEGWQVDWWGEGRPVFFDPRGGAHYEGRWEPPEGWRAPEAGERATQGTTPALAPPPVEVEALLDENERSGASPDGWTASARWKRERDIPDHVLFAALEALG